MQAQAGRFPSTQPAQLLLLLLLLLPLLLNCLRLQQEESLTCQLTAAPTGARTSLILRSLLKPRTLTGQQMHC
jgi:hypothetical protein